MRFYDPLGIISPIIVRFKHLFQNMCEEQLDWDEPLTGELLDKWERLTSDLQHFALIKIPRCYQTRATAKEDITTSFSPQDYWEGLCGRNLTKVEDVNGAHNQFVCSKTRVAPVKRISIPLLEFLSALLLARLLSTVKQVLEPEIQFRSIDCHTDSQVALFWITNREREWKQFVQNRVNGIRELIPNATWRHCLGVLNPTDIPSRGASSRDLQEKIYPWLHGPLATGDVPEMDNMATAREECLTKMKINERWKRTTTLLNPRTPQCNSNYSSLNTGSSKSRHTYRD